MAVQTVRAALETAIAVSLRQDGDVLSAVQRTQKDAIMPEGPEIRRAADSLEAAVKGEP
jgi:hypothetical protein